MSRPGLAARQAKLKRVARDNPTMPLSCSQVLGRVLPDLRAEVKRALAFAVLARLHELRGEWDGEFPRRLAEEDLSGERKPFHTLESYAAGAKGRRDPVPISPGATRVGCALLATLTRVVLACPEGTEHKKNGVADLYELTDEKNRAKFRSGLCHEEDFLIFRQMYRVSRQYWSLDGNKLAYGGMDVSLLVILRKVHPAAARRFEHWGLALVQIYLDYVRASAACIAGLNWYEKVVFNENILIATLQNMSFLTGERSSSSTFTALKKDAATA